MGSGSGRGPTTGDQDEASGRPTQVLEQRTRPPAPGGRLDRAGARPGDPDTLPLGSPGPAASALPAWHQRYRDRGKLARGGMSTIHRVYDQTLGREVAMKVFDAERDSAGLSTFLQEARTTARLDHPNIVAIHDVQHDETGAPSRFTMKLVEGETLATILEREGEGRLSNATLERLLRAFLKVCDAVSFAHSRGVLHLDVKPGNIMIGSHGQVYLMDWGVALDRRAGGGRDAAPGEQARPLSGTPAFMAPEQAWGRHSQIDERTDVYGLGGVLYAILTLSPPHDGNDAQHDLTLARQGRVRPPQQVARGEALPPGLCRIALRALSPEPCERHPSVESLARDVEDFLRGGGWFEAVRFAAGEVIVREGDAPDAAYVITQGECELFREHEGQRRPMHVLRTGDVFGETSIFGGSRRTASVAALSDVTLMRVTRDALTRELSQSAWLRAFVESLARRFIELDQRLRDLGE